MTQGGLLFDSIFVEHVSDRQVIPVKANVEYRSGILLVAWTKRTWVVEYMPWLI